jgi:hypothetical protein
MDRTWYIKEMSRKLIEADAELHRTGFLDIEKLHRSLSFIHGESECALPGRGLQDSIPHETAFDLDPRHSVQLESELSPTSIHSRSNCDDNDVPTAMMGNIMLRFSFD